MSSIGVLYGGGDAHHRALTELKYRKWFDDSLYLPDFVEQGKAAIDGFDTIVVPDRLNRRLLEQSRPALQELLERGGTVVLFGEQGVFSDEPDNWLPGIHYTWGPTNFWWWLDPTNPSPVVAADPTHEFFDHLSLADCTWHHHGSFAPGDGAEMVLATPTGESLLYVDRVSTPGTLVVSSLDPMSHFGSYFMPATEKFLDGFWPWLNEA